MGSTSYLSKPKTATYRMKSGSSAGSDKEIGGKLKRTKIRRPTKLNEYGLKRIPDYTELAYKEAVSKLRYFLSGNCTPSVRSYGGSASLKNLDESDGDIDKKYTSSYLAEYKPRPRLTAKYATLYADSLNNYTPQLTTSAPPATGTGGSGADVSGGTNPDVIHFIQKQEEYIEQLERESQYCRDELNNLLGKVKEVISENEHLHEAQKNKLISRMFHSYNGSESDDLDELGDSTGLDSDNKVTPSKGRKSTKSRFTKLEGPNIVFESRIAELEAQLTQAKIDLKKVQEENNENKRKLASGLVDSTCLDGFKRQIDNLQRDKSSLETQISKLKLNLEQKDDDGRYKRGSDVVEHQLREERNNLEIEIRRLKEELSKERNKVRELAGEGARRAVQERSAAEQRYTAHFDELQHDLSAQYDNVAKLQLDLERQRREENELKREISMKNSAIDELKMELKNKMSSLQADLAQAHAEKASLEEELASARLAMERQQRQAKHESNRLNSEIQSLRQRLDRADADLVHSRRENLRLSEQIANLEKEQTMKNLTPISPVKNKNEKELSTMLESMENKHAKTVAELESMIHSQNSLMEKLTGECRLLTDKLDDANRRHKADKTQLLCRNAELMRKLRSLWSSHKKYCTTITPLRSYTPMSGYPNSLTSYDLDRTYFTSTPNTYRNRFRRTDSLNDLKNDLGGLTRNLSNLSIDRIDDSDDDPIKVSQRNKGDSLSATAQELATLQRQVNGLSISLQSPHPPSTYQAHPTYKTTSDRDVARSISNSGREHSGVEPPGHAQDKSVRAIPTFPTNDSNSTNEITGLNEPNLNETEYETGNIAENETEVHENYQESKYEQKENESDLKLEQEIPMELSQSQEYENSNYQYEQDYDHTQTVDSEYQNQYDQNFEQPEHHFENYEQYTDPNAQYDQQYETYPQERNFEEEHSYDTSEQAMEYPTSHNTEHQPDKSDAKDVNMQQESYDTTRHAQEYQDDQKTIQAQQENVSEQNGSR